MPPLSEFMRGTAVSGGRHAGAGLMAKNAPGDSIVSGSDCGFANCGRPVRQAGSSGRRYLPRSTCRVEEKFSSVIS